MRKSYLVIACSILLVAVVALGIALSTSHSRVAALSEERRLNDLGYRVVGEEMDASIMLVTGAPRWTVSGIDRERERFWYKLKPLGNSTLPPIKIDCLEVMAHTSPDRLKVGSEVSFQFRKGTGTVIRGFLNARKLEDQPRRDGTYVSKPLLSKDDLVTAAIAI